VIVSIATRRIELRRRREVAGAWCCNSAFN
jgi:hypothetical protein